MRIALFQPDMPGNLGTIMRLCACLNVGLDIIEPCGFPLSDRSLKRAALDYAPLADVTRHNDWTEFRAARPERLVLLTTRGATAHHRLTYRSDDILLLGSESAGVPDMVHKAVDERVRIPLRPEARSLNVAVAAGIVLAEALRQTEGYYA